MTRRGHSPRAEVQSSPACTCACGRPGRLGSNRVPNHIIGHVLALLLLVTSAQSQHQQLHTPVHAVPPPAHRNSHWSSRVAAPSYPVNNQQPAPRNWQAFNPHQQRQPGRAALPFPAAPHNNQAFNPSQQQQPGQVPFPFPASPHSNQPPDPFQAGQERHFSPARPPGNIPSGFPHSPRNTQQGQQSGQPVPGVPFELPDRELVTQRLPVAGSAQYTFRVPPGGNISLTVLPCHSQVVWNITYVQARVFSHPFYPTGRRRRRAAETEENGEDLRAEAASSLSVLSRKKRCCVTAGVTHNFNFNIAGLNAGLGTSLGDGAITYFQEDSSGGVYEMNLANNGQHAATYQIFATLRPAISPYVQLPGDPQVKVSSVRHDGMTLHWMPASQQPWPQRDVTYCVEYHDVASAHPADTQASSCSLHRQRPGTRNAGCSASLTRTIANLQPDTEYKVNVYAKNTVSNTETAFLGVKIRTAKMPVAMTRTAEIGSVLPPHSTSVYQLSVNRVQAMRVMVSPCQDQLSWGILDSQGRPVQTFTPTYDTLSPQNAVPSLDSAPSQPLYRPGALALPDLEFMSSVSQPSTVGVIVKNNARRPAKFELYASSAAQDHIYPVLPANKSVRVMRTTPRSIEIGWDGVPGGSHNVTYCVLFYPSEQSRVNGVVHSTCSYKEVERRNRYQPGACDQQTMRRISSIQPDTWYDVDVVAKNTYTRKIKAYSSVRAYTAYSGGSPQFLQHRTNTGVLSLASLAVLYTALS